MLSWLARFWTGVSGTVGNAVSTAAHWAMHALAAVVFSVFRLVGGAWRTLVQSFGWLHAALDHFGLQVWHFATYVVRVLIPRVVRWAAAELARLGLGLYHLAQAVGREVAALYRAIARAVADVTRWAIRTIYDPLKSYADLIWHDLKAWGYTAWWWITHLDKLADAMIIHIANSIEKHAWQLARMLGTFFISLIIANLNRFVLLIEDIVNAVF